MRWSSRFGWLIAGIAVGAAIAAAAVVAMLKAQQCDALMWNREGKEFVWQNLQTYQCSETSQRIAARGILIVGPLTNRFSSTDGRVRDATLTISGEGIQQALQGKFAGQPDGRAHSYNVAVEGILYAADGRQQLLAWAIEPDRGVLSRNGS